MKCLQCIETVVKRHALLSSHFETDQGWYDKLRDEKKIK